MLIFKQLIAVQYYKTVPIVSKMGASKIYFRTCYLKTHRVPSCWVCRAMKSVKWQLMVLSMVMTNVSYALNNGPNSAETLADQLIQLADKNQFTIQGIEKTKTIEFKPVSGDVESKIKQLLSSFNYLLIRTDHGQLERLIILQIKPEGPKRIIVSTQKNGSQHIVNASIKGIAVDWLDVELLVDTGADRIVLPSSLINSLGYVEEQLENQKMQTVNGLVEAKIGQLEAIEIGNEIIPDVGVAFVLDDLLGDIMILGMNVLSRYRMTIDDALQQITLIKEK